MKLTFRNLTLLFKNYMDPAKIDEKVMEREFTENEIGEAFGIALKALRTHKGYSIDKLAKPVEASSSSSGRYRDPYETIATVCRTAGQILALLDPFFSEIEIDEAAGTLTLGYASVIENVVWPILDIFVAEENSGWIDNNLNNLLAAIFGRKTVRSSPPIPRTA